MEKNLEIFLGNKLISCDTVVPLIMSLKKINKNLRVNYNILDNKSYVDIKTNHLLYNAIKQTGKFYLRGSSSSKNKFHKIILKVKLSIFLFILFIKLILGKIKIIHFGVFSNHPFKLLEYLFPKEIYFMEASCFLKHKNVILLDNIVIKRSSKKRKLMSSKNILYFNKNFFRDYNISNKNKVLMKCPRIYRTWYEYITEYGIKKVKSQLNDLHYDYDKGYFIYILGYIGHLDFIYNKNTIEELIPRTIKLLSQYGRGLPILIKPHAITDMNILNKILIKYNYNNVHISYLHPAALAINAKLVVSNYFSVTQSDAHFFGAKTVEYTHYSKLALEKTNGESMNPYYIDHFINNEPKKFQKIIEASIKTNKTNKVRNLYEDTSKSSEVRKYLLNT